MRLRVVGRRNCHVRTCNEIPVVSVLFRLLLTACLAFGLVGAPLIDAVTSTHTENTIAFDEVRPETVAISSKCAATKSHDAAALVRTKAGSAAFGNNTIAFTVLALPHTLTHGLPPSQAPPLA